LATLKQEYHRLAVLAQAVDAVEEEEDCQKPFHLQREAAGPFDTDCQREPRRGIKLVRE
jgi:hypothetical protein